MSTLILAPDSTIHSCAKSIFLAGTIDNGNSTDWQSHVAEELKDLDVAIFNPRRKEWDSSINPRDIDSPFLKEQINWELNALDKADVILLWLEGSSASPISLLELGLHAKSGKLVVGCSPDFYRYANVHFTCMHTGCIMTTSLDDAIVKAKSLLSNTQDLIDASVAALDK